MGWEFSDAVGGGGGLMRGGGGAGEGEGEVTEEKKKKTESRRPETSPPHLTLHSLCARRPRTILTADQRTRASSTLGAPPTGGGDSEQRKSCSSPVGSARQDTSTADRGEGADGLIGEKEKKGDRKRGGRLEGVEGKKERKTQFMDIGEGSGCPCGIIGTRG